MVEKAREFQKNIYFCFIDHAKAFDCVDHNKLWKILKGMGIPDTWPASWETYMQFRKQQLELDMGQQTGSKSGKEYTKVIYCHPAYLTFMQSTSWETLDCCLAVWLSIFWGLSSIPTDEYIIICLLINISW